MVLKRPQAVLTTPACFPLQPQCQGGWGVYSWSNGTIYLGHWREGLAFGLGVSIDAEEDVVYAGDWDHGMRSELGVAKWNREQRCYAGTWRRDAPDGFGVEFYADGACRWCCCSVCGPRWAFQLPTSASLCSAPLCLSSFSFV